MEIVTFTLQMRLGSGTLSSFKIVENVAKMEGVWSLQWCVHQTIDKSMQTIYNHQYKTVTKKSSHG